MKIIIAPDSYKSTISAYEVAGIIGKAAREVFPEAQIIELPIADGGEGSLCCFKRAIGGEYRTVRVSNPLMEACDAKYLLKGSLAVIEIAECAGLPLVEGRKNPKKTSTYGVGELIKDALNNGAREIVLTLGGSATNDCGAGMATALGVRFYDAQGFPFVPTGGSLSDVDTIDASDLDHRVTETVFTAMCDVETPLLGELGASYVFAPQKGATPEDLPLLEGNVAHLAALIREDLGVDVTTLIGGGAAGGLGAGSYAFLGAKLRKGIDLILELCDFDALLEDCDLVITGEGRLDAQSFMGKVVGGISERTLARNIPLYAIVGGIEGLDETALKAHGIVSATPTNESGLPVYALKQTAREDLYTTALKVFTEINKTLS